MKLLGVKALAIEDIKVIQFARFCDHRGYFTEHYRKSDFCNHPDMEFLKGVDFLQCNESYSQKGTIRGLHFQWNPYMGKLVRTLLDAPVGPGMHTTRWNGLTNAHRRAAAGVYFVKLESGPVTLRRKLILHR